MTIKFLKNLALLSVLVFIGFLQFGVKAEAAGVNLPFNVKTSGVLTKDTTANNYTITITEAGRLSLDMTSYVDTFTYITLYDSSNNVIIDDYTRGSSVTPAKYTNWVDVEPGTYRLKISDGDYESNTGSYEITPTFTSAGNFNEVEPNNGTVEAQPLKFNEKLNGFLSWDNTADYFKITVERSGQLNIDLSSYVDTFTYITLLDEDNNEVMDGYVQGSSKNPAKYIQSVDVNKGTYYLKVHDGDYEQNTGKYVVNTTFAAANNNDQEPNNGVVEAQKLTYNKSITGFLAWDDTVDMYKIDVTVPGKVGIDLTSYVDSFTYIELLNSNNNSLIDEYVRSSSGTPTKFKESIELEKGTYYLKVHDGDYEQNTGKYLLTVTPPPNKHIGRVLIRSKEQYLYSPTGAKSRKLRQNEGLRIYKVLSDRYDVGGGYYVKKTKVNLFYVGHVWSKRYSLGVYEPDGSYFKSFDSKEPVRVYGYSNGRYDVGNGYFVNVDDDVQFDR
ncbi:pre-peptidase C-terminal domain-containing protein [Metabacillus halosaccharovorans]|uniref:pre-peptidase C-terminal domain-containing protein n=1 Tax=Metabacillus halosaccharovorans TaxID=930124 RepID=UPI000994F084|nr:pre-peptidase C-terminal domain-containing protein [Metabacillus halosaccharovorans]